MRILVTNDDGIHADGLAALERIAEQLSDDELSELVASAVEESGASEAKDMGGVMKVLMPKVGGRADGKRVSQAVREALGS